MGKWYGKIGYAITEEVKPGVWKPSIITRNYYGEVIQNSRRLQSVEVNDDVTVSNKISIVSDPFANENFHDMRYIEYMGAKWKISNVEVLTPRLILTIGGVYNGQ